MESKKTMIQSQVLYRTSKVKISWYPGLFPHSRQLFCNITLYMHYNAVQSTLFVECSLQEGKNQLNNWKSPAKLKHSYYIQRVNVQICHEQKLKRFEYMFQFFRGLRYSLKYQMCIRYMGAAWGLRGEIIHWIKLWDGINGTWIKGEHFCCNLIGAKLQGTVQIIHTVTTFLKLP